MGLSKRNIALAKKSPQVKESERCEMRHSAANLPIHRCDKAGVNYRVTGKLSTGFAVLCNSHKAVFERQGYTLELVSPIEESGRAAIAL
jgi:hypothetical protein